MPDKKKTPKKSSRRRKTIDDADGEDGATTDAGSETDVSFSEIEGSSTNFSGSPHVASSPLASLIERSWKSGIAELVGRKESEKEKEEVALEQVDKNEGTKEDIPSLGTDGKEGEGQEKHDGEGKGEKGNLPSLESNEEEGEGKVDGEKEFVPNESKGDKDGKDDEETDKELLDIIRDAAKECDDTKENTKTDCVDEDEEKKEGAGKSVEVDDSVNEGNENDSKDEVETESSRVMIEKDEEGEKEEGEQRPLTGETPRQNEDVNSARCNEVNLDCEEASCVTPEEKKPTSDEIVTKSVEDLNSAKSAEEEKEETNTEGTMVVEGEELESSVVETNSSMSESVAEGVEEDELHSEDNESKRKTTESQISNNDPERMEGVEEDDLDSEDEDNNSKQNTAEPQTTSNDPERMEVVADDEPQSSPNQKTPDADLRDTNFNETEASKDVSKVPEDPFPLPDNHPAVDDDSDDDDDDDDDEARQLAAIFKDPEEAALESIVFGDDDEIVQELEKKKEDSSKSKKRKRDGETEKGVLDGDEGKTSAWSDNDDYDERIDTADPRHQKKQGGSMKGKEGGVIQGAALKKKLKRDFVKVMGETPTWAMTGARKKEGDDDDDEDGINPLLTRAGNFLNDTKGTKLGFAGGILDWKKCCRANRQERGKQLRTIQFHPSAQVRVSLWCCVN